MSKHIGIVACSAEGAALCYRTICMEARDEMGDHMHPEITMHTHPLGLYTPHFPRQDWQAVADLMVSSAKHVASCGAEFAISPDNTIHQAWDMVIAASPIPWLHIAEAVALEAKARGMNKLAVLGTKFLMTGPVYPDMLDRYGIAHQIPDEAQRERINQVIFNELVYNDIREVSRLYFNDVIADLKGQGCEGVVLGCTEIPLLVDPADCPLPTLDSTRLLARYALRHSLTS